MKLEQKIEYFNENNPQKYIKIGEKNPMKNNVKLEREQVPDCGTNLFNLGNPNSVLWAFFTLARTQRTKTIRE